MLWVSRLWDGRCPWRMCRVGGDRGRGPGYGPLLAEPPRRSPRPAPGRWGANCRAGREATHRCSPPLRGYSQAGRQAHRCLTTAHGSRALWAMSEALQGSPLIRDMLFGWRGTLFTLLLFSHSTTQGINYFTHREKKKNTYVHTCECIVVWAPTATTWNNIEILMSVLCFSWGF